MELDNYNTIHSNRNSWILGAGAFSTTEILDFYGDPENSSWVGEAFNAPLPEGAALPSPYANQFYVKGIGDFAANRAAGYSTLPEGNGYNDWHLPSVMEMY